ncbi:MAG TPA: hypothetical protein VHV28_00470 [Solirubrobacteraceae bacterium]|jgi:hypothetical protein|nr:hypothetical protein [Solirubrobacteraceae bacterium]
MGAASSASVSARTTGPPCTQRALNVGVHRGATPFGATSGVYSPWGCSGRFAYGNFDVDGNEITVLFIASGRGWKTASRGRYCTNHSVPRRIYHNACEVN